MLKSSLAVDARDDRSKRIDWRDEAARRTRPLRSAAAALRIKWAMIKNIWADGPAAEDLLRRTPAEPSSSTGSSYPRSVANASRR